MIIKTTTQEEFLNVFIAWLAAESGFKFIRAFPSAGRPSGDAMYGTVLFMDTKTVGRPEKIHEPSGNLEPDPLQILETIQTMQKVDMSVTVYQSKTDDKTFDIADALRLKLQSSSAVEHFTTEGIGFIKADKVRNLYPQRDFSTEVRSKFDCCFYITTAVTSLIDNIEGIEIEAYKKINNGSPKLINTTLTERN